MSAGLFTYKAINKAERVKSLIEWRAMSCMLWHISLRSIDNFDLPSGYIVKPLAPDEIKCVDRRDPVFNLTYSKLHWCKIGGPELEQLSLAIV